MDGQEAERHLKRWMHHAGHAHVQGSYEFLRSALTDLCAPGLVATATLHDDRAKRRLVLAGHGCAVIWHILETEHVQARLWTAQAAGTEITVDCKAALVGQQTLRETRDWTFCHTTGDALTLRMVTVSMIALAGSPQRQPEDPDAHTAIWRMAQAAGWPVPPTPAPAAT